MSRLIWLRCIRQLIESSGVDLAVIALLSRCCFGLSDPVLEVVKACHGVCAGSVFAVLMHGSDATSQSRCESGGCTDRADELLRLCVHRYLLSVEL